MATDWSRETVQATSWQVDHGVTMNILQEDDNYVLQEDGETYIGN